MISAKQLAWYATMLRDVLWPHGSWQQRGGSRSSSAAAASSEQATKPGETRDDAMKLRTRVLCRAVMFGSVAGESPPDCSSASPLSLTSHLWSYRGISALLLVSTS